MRLAGAAVALVALAVVVAPTARAQLATFDNLAECVPTNTGGSLIPNGYSGFEWTNFYVADGPNAAAAFAGGAGYANGVVTARCIAANGFGAPAQVSAAAPFTFNGGFFTAAFTNGLSVQITGFNGPTQLFQTVLALNTAGPQLLDVTWGNVTRVLFSTGAGSPGSQFVFDNFRFNNTPDPAVVPEPSVVALMLGGLGALAAAAARRRRA